ncbi:MAG: family N-acetyltransferase [Candidatus Poribacteria bacterium]|nr:family N-acetyltransferase [Candidatus Poribacteria bacterium]
MPVEYVEILNPDSDALTKFHDNVLIEAFPDFYVLEDLPILRKNIENKNWTDGNESCRYHLFIARRDSQVVGGMSFYFFSFGTHAIGMGSYIAVKKEHRRGGIGRKLIDIRDQILFKDAHELDCYVKGLVVQVNDPSLMSIDEIKQDSMDPWKREMFWRRRGYRKIAFNFIQPAIKVEYPPIEYLSLHIFPYSSEWKEMKRISKNELNSIVYCFVKCTGTVGPMESDPAYQRMKTELDEQDFFAVM